MRRDFSALKYGAIVLLLSAVLAVILITGAAEADFVQNPGISGTRSTSYEQKLSQIYSDALESENPAVLSFAYLRISPENAGNYSVAQAFDLWDFTNKNWIIISDPRGPEYVSSATGTIRAGMRGDCDDYSVFLSSLIMSAGGRCRIVTAQGAENMPGHAYPELFIGNNESEVKDFCKSVVARYGCEKVYYSFNGEDEKTAYWLNLDWIIPKVFGPDYYTYGNSRAEIDMYHPGRVYYPSGTVTFYYGDGIWKKDSPSHGYYMRKFGEDTLNVL